MRHSLNSSLAYASRLSSWDNSADSQQLKVQREGLELKLGDQEVDMKVL